MTDHLESAPVAYQNEPFLDSPDGRILRILAEYQEPLARFRREQIQDTVVFFGSARFQGEKDAAAALAAIKKDQDGTPVAQLVGHLVDELPALVILLAYFPPKAIQTRLGVTPIQTTS